MSNSTIFRIWNGKTLTFSQQMTGTAEIITDDLRLRDRLLNPVRAVVKK